MDKIARYPRLVFVCLFIIIYYLAYLLELENPLLRTVSSVTLAFVLSPKRKKIKTQTGEKTQVTWFLLKKPIIID